MSRVESDGEHSSSDSMPEEVEPKGDDKMKPVKKAKGKSAYKSKSPKSPGVSAAAVPGTFVRRKKTKETYATHLYKVLKQIHPELSISKRGMLIMNSFMNDIFDRIATEATRLMRSSQKKTLTCREVETSVKLMLPGELSKHAVTEGSKSVAKYRQQAGM
mmetsp:Transcript_50892/g.135842  ORF Transcript_50892/g.135842 Transcript_50892/m.135842 type:complete len:160 (-) Transcript_50892:190-669(-)